MNESIESVDLSRRQFVLAAAATCACAICPSLAEAQPAGGAIDVGPLSAIPTGVTTKWVKTSKFFLVRSEGKVYAPSATCTHKRATLGAEGSTIVCENHGSTFSLDGAVTKGPARRSLPRYAMRKDDKGNVIVDTSKSFNEDKWQDAEAFINA